MTESADLNKRPDEVASMFDAVSKRYDLTNVVLSFGQDRRWRAATCRALGLRAGQVVLDIAAGTAVSTVELTKSGAYAIAADFSLGMLKAGAGRDVPKIAADALALPFAKESFDAVTVSFGLRNVNDVVRALSEMRRILRPGGRLVICEFSTPTWHLFRTVYHKYLMRALPSVAARVSSNPEAYRYLAESILDWPNQESLADIIRDTGFHGVHWHNLTGGIAALHSAVK